MQGRTFRTFLSMYKTCPHCGVRFECESGYFLTAMFFAYAIGFVIVAPTALYLYFGQVPAFWFTAIITAELLLLWPFIFRYSRVLWMHADQLLDPRRPEELQSPAETQFQAELPS